MSEIKPIFQWQHTNRTVLPYSWWQDCTEADFKVRDNKTQFNVRIVFETTAIIESLRSKNAAQKDEIKSLSTLVSETNVENEQQAKRIAELEAKKPKRHVLTEKELSDPEYMESYLEAMHDDIDECVKYQGELKAENAEQARRIADLEGEDKISVAVIERSCNLLAQIAITLKGEPKELTRHDYHDLPELVSVLHLENELNKARIEDLEEDLQFVERWANHHGTKPNITVQEALSCIQHYPSISAITKNYKDGIIPNTRNPYAEIEAQAKRIAELEAAVKANHEWHQEHDDYDGYQESALYTTNTSTLSASKNGAENGK